MAKVFIRKSRKEINFNYRQRKKEKFNALQDEVISLRECVAELKGQLKLLKELHAQLIVENGLLQSTPFRNGLFNSIVFFQKSRSFNASSRIKPMPSTF
ncbi:5983_t:CDS:2 [Dentiscutata erythropus]|uniref:5983_t:CDS:1 n=1 Tax=Dentiscutata erythropus TaxID=1348616 RepID=A0A9N9D1R9_9GLOM|nr:5983_t:CDS:2 [Dentiscutata erythropus]